ncbi:MAG: DUF2304 family protein [Alphaproteobacteria bacterium]|nr:DUF2304 family protein [Alphaproteobacteria bacterium]
MLLRKLIIVALALVLWLLYRRGLIRVDITTPWLIGFVLLGFFYDHPLIDNWLTPTLGVSFPIYAILLLSVGLLLALVTSILVMASRIHVRGIALARRLAGTALHDQARHLAAHGSPPC